jgi:hypothetical protein
MVLLWAYMAADIRRIASRRGHDLRCRYFNHPTRFRTWRRRTGRPRLGIKTRKRLHSRVLPRSTPRRDAPADLDVAVRTKSEDSHANRDATKKDLYREARDLAPKDVRP